MILKCVSIINDQPLFDGKLEDLLDECIIGSALQVLSPLDYISYQQIKWWKGVLLPALSKDSGDSISWWETTLKFAVMPDEFAPETIKIKGQEYCRIPSITKLSVKKMNQLIEGSVAYCHEIGLMWINLPDAELRFKPAA
jgi:hypothetical protein